MDHSYSVACNGIRQKRKITVIYSLILVHDEGLVTEQLQERFSLQPLHCTWFTFQKNSTLII